mgnify:CR=1 FL=1
MKTLKIKNSNDYYPYHSPYKPFGYQFSFHVNNFLSDGDLSVDSCQYFIQHEADTLLCVQKRRRGPEAYMSTVLHTVLVIQYVIIRVTARMNAHHILETLRKGKRRYFGRSLGSYMYRKSS